MSQRDATLLCWHAERAGVDVLENALKALRNRQVLIRRVLYLVQAGRKPRLPRREDHVVVEVIELALEDPTCHARIYSQIRGQVLPRLHEIEGELHLNVSPGTPAMHSVWLILHAGGALPAGTRIWSSQFNSDTKRTRIDEVDFPINTYLSEIHRRARAEPDLAVYEPEARSRSRCLALENLARYAMVAGAPLLILGERGTGKTRLVETIVASLKGRPKIVTVPCGGLDSSLAESQLFGHRKGAFTGAAADRQGLLREADGGVLFLDEVQDLPKSAQRLLVRVFQDRQRRFRPLGSDREESVDVELVSASNLSIDALRERLDADLFDRLSHLLVSVPALRECREDIQEDWARVWRELRQRDDLPRAAPWSAELQRALQGHVLPGNLRDLQRLAVLVMAWWSDDELEEGLRRAIGEWNAMSAVGVPEQARFGQGSRAARVRWFRAQLAIWAKGQFGSWASAARQLACDEKTLRQDAGHAGAEAVGGEAA